MIDLNELSTEGLLRAPFGILVQILGEPLCESLDKCSTAWFLEGTSAMPVEAFIKDWQDEDDASFSLTQFRSLPSYDWHVYARSVRDLEQFCRWLSAEVIAKARQSRSISAEAKANVNALIAQGLSPAEALKRAGSFTEGPDPTPRFAWPIARR